MEVNNICLGCEFFGSCEGCVVHNKKNDNDKELRIEKIDPLLNAIG